MGSLRKLFARSALMLFGASLQLAAQWSMTYESMYLPGRFNWAFRHNYSVADKLFNGFDYGHSILYETLYSTPSAPVSKLEEDRYNFITRELLVHPPHVPLEETAIEVAYVKIAPEAKGMFDWAHLLHRQIYDVWADERLSEREKDAEIAKLLRYYKTRPDLAFSSKPKTMELMEGQPYSLAFRQKYPKFNGLIWAYHWLQVGLYEPLIAGKDKSERITGVTAAVSRFWQMIENPPSNMPRIMPMTAAISPRFADRYPEAAIIFDNLHAMHDVISDILASDKVPRERKRAEILRAAQRYRDDTSFVMTVAEWKDMARMMGIQNMGGPVTGFLAEFPTPTLERGASMVGMQHGAMGQMPKMPGMAKDSMATHMNMPGMSKDSMATHMNMPGMSKDSMAAHMNMPGMPKDSTAAHMNMPGMTRNSMMGHAGHAMPDSAMRMDSMTMDMRNMMELHERMLRDPVIRDRVMADSVMRRLMGDTTMMPDMMRIPSGHGAHRDATPPTRTKKTTTAPTAAKKPATKTAPAKKPASRTPAEDTKKRMPGMKMPGMKMP